MLQAAQGQINWAPAPTAPAPAFPPDFTIGPGCAIIAPDNIRLGHANGEHDHPTYITSKR